MRLTIRNREICLICNKSIVCFEGYKCHNCKNSFHKRCILDSVTHNNNIIRCLVCQQFIFFQTSLMYNVTKCLLCELMPCLTSIGAIIGLFVFLAIPKN